MNNEINWQGAHWVGVPEAEYRKQPDRPRYSIETAYFRHVVNLQEPVEMELSISASTRYRLWINGKPVLSGPCKSDRWHRFYETIDAGSYMKTGDNIIAVKVVAFPPYEAQDGDNRGPFWAVSNAAGPCLVVKGECKNREGKVLADITTGKADWKVCLDKAVSWKMSYISFWMGSMESVDGASLPCGWRDSLKPEGDWVSVHRKWTTEKNMFGEIQPFPLKPRPIPFLYEKRKEFVGEMPIKKGDLAHFTFAAGDGDKLSKPAVIPADSRMAVELNSGELTTGYITLPFEGGKGSKVVIRYTESYVKRNGDNAEKGIRDDALNCEFEGHEDVYKPSGNKEAYEPFWFRTFRFVRIEVETGSDALTIYPPVYDETGYPLDVKTHVESSADWLKPLWDISLRTLRRCMHETYEDCPYYEQLQYTMDTRLQMLFTYTVSGDTRMARRTLEDYHSSILPEGILQSRYPSNLPQVIPAFSLHWIFMLEDYYWQTGDASVPKRYRPTVDAVLDYFDRKMGPLGLIEKLGYWDQADWVEEWSDIAGTPRAALHGPSTIHNLIYCYTLQVGARLMKATGRPGVAAEYEKRASDIMKKVDELCWNEKEGLFMEGPDFFEEYSQHAQVWSVMCGLASGDRARRVMKNAITRKGMLKCSFPLMFYVYRALEKAGMYEETEQQWDMWKSLLPLHLTTVPETPFKPRSECHAWGSLPLYEFSRSILGVNPSEPGWEKIVIAPKCLSLHDAKGEAVTAKGPVKVEWTNSQDGFHMAVEAPEGVPAEIITPDGNRFSMPKGGKFNI